VDRIANAVLYEGYILYPYRPSVKNRQRWTFGGLYPEAYCRTQSGADAPANQTECLVHGSLDRTLEVTVRFLHLTDRTVGEFIPPLPAWPDGAAPPFRPVQPLQVGDRQFHPWQEAEEREVSLGGLPLDEVLDQSGRRDFQFPGRRWLEPVAGTAGEVVGVLVREQEPVQGLIEVTATRVAGALYRATVRVRNCTTPDGGDPADREAALRQTLLSTHTILGVRGGEFVSLLDPPEECCEAAAACRNVGTWPVLVGEDGETDAMLSSPIILYDYPQLAPESPGDLFDATEIDEILTLRVLTLTDDEKRTMAEVDERARALLTRTEALAPDELGRLHGALRGLRRQ
jgi:hypothetical protein